MKKGMYVVLVLLLLVAFGASAVYLGNYFLESKKDADLYNELSAVVENARKETEAPTETTEAPTEAPAETENPYGVAGEVQEDVQTDEPENKPEKPATSSGGDLLPWYKEIHEKNSDMVGWIQIEGTKIDYPVMQTEFENSNYYLYRNFEKEENARGCIYARETCDVFGPSDNVTLYGHNMKDGSMFAFLSAYIDKAAWEEKPLIFFDTLTESHVYKIFSVFKTSANENQGFAYHEFENAKDKADFDKFISTCKELAFYDTGVTPVYGDKIICLSTCEYTLDNGRFVVAAVRIT